MKDQLHARIERDGSYHRAESHPDAPRAFDLLRQTTKDLAHMTVDLCPEGRELSLALTALLDDFLPLAIGAIARDDGNSLDPEMIRKWESLRAVTAGRDVTYDAATAAITDYTGIFKEG